MTLKRSSRIAAIVRNALGLSADSRSRVFDATSSMDEVRRSEVAAALAGEAATSLLDAAKQPARNGTSDPIVSAGDGGDRYLIGRELARGGMGAVREAQDVRLSRRVAVKHLLTRSAGGAARLRREALLTARLQHPGVVPVFDSGELPDGSPFYAMKLVEGTPLDAAIARAPTLDARVALLPHAIAAIDAVAYAHSRGIVHRDLKPHNVLVGAFGETVVVDWGLAKEVAVAEETTTIETVIDDTLTRAGTVLGTPAYMAPEQAAGQPVDARADVYALGAMLYHLLAGSRAPVVSGAVDVDADGNGGRTLAARMPQLPIDLVAIVERAMARRPADRYPTAADMAADLRRFQTGQLVAAHHYTPWQLIRRLAARSPGAVVLGAAATLAVVFMLAVVVVRQVRVRELRLAKQSLDGQIADIERAMANTYDGSTLRGFEDRLDDAVARARVASQALAGTAPIGRGDDPLERRIHAVLAGFDADTYSIPPRFRDVVAGALDHAVDVVARAYASDAKSAVWPIITRELDDFGLPRELGYLAWLESNLNPSLVFRPVDAAGLWQLRRVTAREYGLRVDDAVDERLDPAKSTHVAVRMFAQLFAQFGDDATLMAVLAYPLGEQRTRQFVSDIAMEKGAWRSGRRSYWHLFRTHRMSAETEDYVPRVVALILADRAPR